MVCPASAFASSLTLLPTAPSLCCFMGLQVKVHSLLTGAKVQWAAAQPLPPHPASPVTHLALLPAGSAADAPWEPPAMLCAAHKDGTLMMYALAHQPGRHQRLLDSSTRASARVAELEAWGWCISEGGMLEACPVSSAPPSPSSSHVCLQGTEFTWQGSSAAVVQQRAGPGSAAAAAAPSSAQAKRGPRTLPNADSASSKQPGSAPPAPSTASSIMYCRLRPRPRLQASLAGAAVFTGLVAPSAAAGCLCCCTSSGQLLLVSLTMQGHQAPYAAASAQAAWYGLFDPSRRQRFPLPGAGNSSLTPSVHSQASKGVGATQAVPTAAQPLATTAAGTSTAAVPGQRLATRAAAQDSRRSQQANEPPSVAIRSQGVVFSHDAAIGAALAGQAAAPGSTAAASSSSSQVGRGSGRAGGQQAPARQQRRLGEAALLPRPIRDLLRGQGCYIEVHELPAPTASAMQLLAAAGAGAQQPRPLGSRSHHTLTASRADDKRSSKAPAQQQRQGPSVQQEPQQAQVQQGVVDSQQPEAVSLMCLSGFGGGNLIMGLSNGVCCVVQLQV